MIETTELLTTNLLKEHFRLPLSNHTSECQGFTSLHTDSQYRMQVPQLSSRPSWSPSDGGSSLHLIHFKLYSIRYLLVCQFKILIII